MSRDYAESLAEVLRDLGCAKEEKVQFDSYLNYKVDGWERHHQAVRDWKTPEYPRLY